jgi:hypothetical protein
MRRSLAFLQESGRGSFLAASARSVRGWRSGHRHTVAPMAEADAGPVRPRPPVGAAVSRLTASLHNLWQCTIRTPGLVDFARAAGFEVAYKAAWAALGDAELNAGERPRATDTSSFSSISN